MLPKNKSARLNVSANVALASVTAVGLTIARAVGDD
jgi:hypothetical protein